jgi:hypothetical protein
VDATIISIGGTIQLIGLAVVAIMILVLGARVAGQGPRGFSSLLIELGTLLVAVYILARPNDVGTLLLHGVGGVQTLAALH